MRGKAAELGPSVGAARQGPAAESSRRATRRQRPHGDAGGGGLDLDEGASTRRELVGVGPELAPDGQQVGKLRVADARGERLECDRALLADLALRQPECLKTGLRRQLCARPASGPIAIIEIYAGELQQAMLEPTFE
jgi:hypothetical protein